MMASSQCEFNRVKRSLKLVTFALVAITHGMLVVLPARAATLTTLYSFGIKPGDPQRPEGQVAVFQGAIYGTLNSLKLFKLSPQRDKLHVIFDGPDTVKPLAELNGDLYGFGFTTNGTTETIFRINHLTNSGSVVYTFPYNVFPGYNLKALNGLLYGTASTVTGSHRVGTLFSFDPTSATLTTVHTQAPAEGNEPVSLASHDGFLYGAASSSDEHRDGTVFKFDPATGQETTVHRFTTGGRIVGSPSGGVLVHNHELFGFTEDEAPDSVSIYRVNIETGGTTLLQYFDYQATGAFPNQSLVFYHGLLYGTLASSNANPGGTVYTLNPKSGVLATIFAFSGGADGASPNAGLTLANGVLYGTTYETNVGTDKGGTIFKLTP